MSPHHLGKYAFTLKYHISPIHNWKPCSLNTQRLIHICIFFLWKTVCTQTHTHTQLSKEETHTKNNHKIHTHKIYLLSEIYLNIDLYFQSQDNSEQLINSALIYCGTGKVCPVVIINTVEGKMSLSHKKNSILFFIFILLNNVSK